MNLRKKCAFSMDKVSDMILLHEDVSNILEKSCKHDDSSPELFISNVRKYLSDRPNIHKHMSPEESFDDFVMKFCHLHLKAHTMHSVLSGEETREEVIESVADDIKRFKKFNENFLKDKNDKDNYEREVAIPTRVTGVVILNSVEKQRERTDKSLMNMIDSDSALA